jgi:biopolymer transport protein ExbB
MLATLRDIAQAGGWVLGAILALSTLAWVLLVCKWLELAEAQRLVADPHAAQAGTSASLADLLVAVHVRGHRMADKVLSPLMEAARVHLERHLGLIAGLAVVLPLLGLLGTVLGMVTTFDVITVHGTGEPRLMANGIRQALLTTKAGLLAALPILLAHELLAARARQIGNALRLKARRRALEEG